MAVNFSESKTKENLMRAFAGESQARNRYTIAAKKADDEGMHTIADIFRYTAEQERAHAERYYDLLKSNGWRDDPYRWKLSGGSSGRPCRSAARGRAQ